MRTEKEMFDLILGTAENDERVRAVYMNGSRANPSVEKDRWRDYDIVYVVTETASFLEDTGWIVVFGEAAIVQQPDSNDFGWGIDHDFSRSYGWLILLMDGSRIDLRIMTLQAALEEYTSDTLTVPLLDKDRILPPIPPSNDCGYWVRKPTRQQYDGCCNEFWWCLNNVAKGIVRDQLPYAMRIYIQVVHVELDHMLEWYVGLQHQFQISTGKWGKYLKKYLPADWYDSLTHTYADGSYEHLWDAIFTACELFRLAAGQVGDSLGFSYNRQDDENMMRYLQAMRSGEI